MSVRLAAHEHWIGTCDGVALVLVSPANDFEADHFWDGSLL
jgi:hypothetical protein